MRLIIYSIFGLVALLLSSCADTPWPHWISGEPTREELDAYQGPIAMPNPDTDGKEWPNLADVPAKPKIILADNKKDALVSEMKTKNTQGLAEITKYNAAHPPIAKPSVVKHITKKK